jgi:hypothetical protein
MAELIRTVRRFDVLLLVVAIDMSAHSEAGINAHKTDQCRKIRASLQPSMRADRVERIEGLADRSRRFPRNSMSSQFTGMEGTGQAYAIARSWTELRALYRS